MSLRWVAAAGLLALSAGVRAQVDLSHLDRDLGAPRAQVLVLGTMHLSGIEGFDPASLAPLLDRLAAFKPDLIAVEDIAGESCDLFARHPAVYPEEVRSYCPDPAPARAATGLDVPAAIAEARKLMKDWPAQPTAAQRRRLAALLLAADERTSALVQWLQLPAPERRAGDGLDDALVALLERRAASANESSSIAARLAARLGLQRVHAIDDHTGDNVEVPDEAAFERAIRQAWDAGRERAAPLRRRQDELARAGDMLALYREINRPETLSIAIDSDFGAALRSRAPGHPAQMYVAGWETRNLRMVANIRAAFRERPGARVLVVVGSSHKPWFDSLLGQMQGVDIVDVQQVLR